MKRYAISFVLLVSAFACSRGPVATAPAVEAVGTTTGTTTIELASDDVIELTEDQSDAADDLVHTVPSGNFASVASFCEAQTKLVAKKIDEANAASKADGMEDMHVEASCKESPDVLHDANIALAAPYTDVKAVTFETGYSTESYLLVQRDSAWTAVRSSVLYWNHWDPGCGSIERPSAVLEVHVEKGALVVKTSANRSWSGKDDEAGELTLTYARACRNTSMGIACGTAEVVGAKVDIRTSDETDPAPVFATRFFSTTYVVGGGVAIETATRFDESQL